jgi:predicted ArsR family transcriptional regulator
VSADPLDHRSLEARVLAYLAAQGPAWARKLAEVFGVQETRARRAVDLLRRQGLAQRVARAEVSYPARGRAKKVKHRNHAYFEPTRQGLKLLKSMDPPPQAPDTPVLRRAGQRRG